MIRRVPPAGTVSAAARHRRVDETGCGDGQAGEGHSSRALRVPRDSEKARTEGAVSVCILNARSPDRGAAHQHPPGVSTEDFVDQSAVADGASGLIYELFGPELGRHARTSVGVAQLPRNGCVELGLVASLSQ